MEPTNQPEPNGRTSIEELHLELARATVDLAQEITEGDQADINAAGQHYREVIAELQTRIEHP